MSRLDVWIDAGHGKGDSGAVGNGVEERAANAKLAAYVANRLNDHRLRVDTDIDHGNPRTSDAVPIAVKADPRLFVSFHHNAATAAARGIETWHAGSAESRRLAKWLNANVLAALRSLDASFLDRGAKDVANDRRAQWIVRNAWKGHDTVTALIEFAFLSNAKDAAVVKQPRYTTVSGEAVVRTIIDYGRARSWWTATYKAPAAPAPAPAPSKPQTWHGVFYDAAGKPLGHAASRDQAVAEFAILEASNAALVYKKGVPK